MPVLSAEQMRAKDAAARLRECFDGARMHLRAGSWRELEGAEVSVVAVSVWDLHGTECTCCPVRDGAVA